MPAYDAANFQPPAPVATVSLRDSQAGAMVNDVLMLIDTGADITLLPQASVNQLGVSALANQQYEVMGFDGARSFASVVELDMIFLGRAYRGRYLLINDTHGILGRDVLNHVSILLDGPQSQWTEQP
jgi:predicted aspartyl protease